MLDIGERAIELMFSVYCHTGDKKDDLSIYLIVLFTLPIKYYCSSNLYLI